MIEELIRKSPGYDIHLMPYDGVTDCDRIAICKTLNVWFFHYENKSHALDNNINTNNFNIGDIYPAIETLKSNASPAADDIP